MVISCDRFLDETSRYHLALALTTKTLEMHGLLSALPGEVREQLTSTLARALDEVEAILKPHVGAAKPAPETSSFGCGT
jgi:hypothetical protein